MTLDEINELANSSDMEPIVASAGETVRELSKLLAANRSLARPSRRERHTVSKLIGLAAERTGVRVPTTIPALEVEVGLLATTHALALILDLAAGPVPLGRTVEIDVSARAAFAVLTVTGPAAALQPLPSTFNDVMALASFAFAREAGQIRCGPNRFTIRLPLAT